VLVVVKNSVTTHVGSDLELAVLDVGSSCVEHLVGNTNGRPSLVQTSVATPYDDLVHIGVSAITGVDTNSLVLVGFEVSEAT
jgi:hypothetical protein